MSDFAQPPSKIRELIIECFYAGLVPFITSSPGLGKSSIIHQIAEEHDLEVIDLRLSQCAPEDLMGLPMRVGEGKEMRAAFVPFEMFPTETTPLPKGKKGWILFLDEMNSASKSVQAAAYKIVLDRMAGQTRLHPACVIVAAGNKATDRAIVTPMGTAMQSRLIHLEMEPSLKDFLDYAVPAGFDTRVLGFLEFLPGKLHHFNPDHQDVTFACPRTWEFASKLIQDKTPEQISLPLLAGTLSSGVAIEFMAFLRQFGKLPKLSEILANPTGTPVPMEIGARYALISMLYGLFDPDDFDAVVEYVLKFPPELQVLYFRGVVRKDPTFIRDKRYTQARRHLVSFLTEEEVVRAA